MTEPLSGGRPPPRSDDQSGVPAGGQPTVRLLRHADLTADDRAAWAALSAQAGADNVFVQEWLMDAALAHCVEGAEVRLAVVSRGQEPWLGVMPLTAKTAFGRWPLPLWQSWLSTNQFLATPLVSVPTAPLFWTSLLAFLDHQPGNEIMLHFEKFDADHPVCAALFECCRQEGRAFQVLNCSGRPAYRPHDDTEGGCAAKIQSRLRNLWQRLAREHGPVAITVLGPDQPCDPWIDAFLAMEASGWKGRGGSALGSSAATAAFFRTVIERGHQNGAARLSSLSANGHVIAMSSWFESPTWGHGFKKAYDETYRAYAPGQLLTRDIRDRIRQQGGLSFDTCVPLDANPSHRLWASHRKIVDGVVAIGPPWRRLQYGAVMKARATYAAVKSRLPGSWAGRA